jgi:hypothetical protein
MEGRFTRQISQPETGSARHLCNSGTSNARGEVPDAQRPSVVVASSAADGHLIQELHPPTRPSNIHLH